jgi:hypothetical protein
MERPYLPWRIFFLTVCFFWLSTFVGGCNDPPPDALNPFLPGTEPSASQPDQVPNQPTTNPPETGTVPPLPTAKTDYFTLPDNSLGTVWNMDCTTAEPASTNFPGATNPECLVVNDNPGNGYSLIGKFDVEKYPPQIISATLQLYCLDKSEDAREPSGYSVDRDWEWPTLSSHQAPFCFGFLEPFIFDSASPVKLDKETWSNVDITSAYNDWQRDAASNKGLVLLSMMANEYGVFASGKYPDESRRPRLKIVYTPKLDLLLPLPQGPWLLGTQCGGKVCDTPDQADKFHQGDHFYSLDFLPAANPSNPSQRLLTVPILAAAEGEVVEAGWSDKNGWYVRLDHGWGYRTVYCHFQEGSIPVSVVVGKRVPRGRRLGLMGSTPGGDYSTGVHLHFGITFEGNGSIKVPELYHNVKLEDRHWTDFYIWCAGGGPVNFWSSTNREVK